MKEESTTLLAPSGFSITSKWRLLSSTEDAEEPKNVNLMLPDPSEGKDNRSKGIYDGNKDKNCDKV